MFQSKQVAARKPLPEPTSAVHPVTVYGEFVVPAALPLNSIIEMVGIPAGTVPVSWKIVCDDCDSNGAPTMTISAGLLSGLYGTNDDTRTIGTSFMAANTVPQSAGIVSDTKPSPFLMTASDNDKGVGIQVTAAAATLIVGARIRMFMNCVSAESLLS